MAFLYSTNPKEVALLGICYLFLAYGREKMSPLWELVKMDG